MKPGGGSLMLWGAPPLQFLKVEDEMEAENCKEIQEERLL